jgi:hypothetical protein
MATDDSGLQETVLIQELHAHACASNLPTYRDPVTGFDVFTADFLRRRGYCCGSGCRHCPYGVIASNPGAGLNTARQ